jgi:hypothetical protein
MDALSLSHLTYCVATVTVNFHRLDHPPFPCRCRLLPDEAAIKHREETNGNPLLLGQKDLTEYDRIQRYRHLKEEVRHFLRKKRFRE